MNKLDEMFDDPIFQIDELIKEAKRLKSNLEKIERQTMTKANINTINSNFYFYDALEDFITDLAFAVYEDSDQIFRQASEGLTGDMVDEMRDNAKDIIRYQYVKTLLERKNDQSKRS